MDRGFCRQGTHHRNYCLTDPPVVMREYLTAAKKEYLANDTAEALST